MDAGWTLNVLAMALSVCPETKLFDISLLRLTRWHMFDSAGFAENSKDIRCGLIPPGHNMPARDLACQVI